ncbi:MAG: hypothetical protein RIS09_1146 [Actinomycetota bacterium]
MNATIEVQHLTKRFGDFVAVNNISFSVNAGRVTGFLGPNGAGKSTTLRCLTGLITPTSGNALITGIEYKDLAEPLRIVGTALETTGFHPGRTGFDNLMVSAVAADLTKADVTGALKQVGMFEASSKRVEAYSLGMKQRLALAFALMGNPDILILDEPANGLDPEGIAWLRGFLRHHAENGGTVLLSSHVLSEVQQTVDDIIIISKGELKLQCTLEELVKSTEMIVSVKSPQLEKLLVVLEQDTRFSAITLNRTNSQSLHVKGMTAAEVGALSFSHSIELHELSETQTDLEQVFLSITGGEA